MSNLNSSQGQAQRVPLNIIAAWVFSTAAAVIFSLQLIKQLDNPGSDFSSYYTAGYLASKGEPISHFYDDKWFMDKMRKVAPGYKDIYNANLPTMAFFVIPLSIGSERQSRIAWMLISLLALFYIMRVSADIVNMSNVARPIWYGVVILAQPVFENFKLGQVYIVITAGLFWMYQSLLKDKEIKVGFILASLLMFKSVGAVFWPYFVLKRQWKLLFLAGCTVFFMILITFPIVGSEGWMAYFAKAVELSKSPYQSVTAYQTIQSWFQHMFSPHPVLQTKPIVHLPLILTKSFATFVNIVLLSTSLWLSYKYPKNTRFHFASFVILVLICMPVSTLHAYMIALVPTVLLLKNVDFKTLNLKGIMVLIGSAMILIPLPFRASMFFDGYWALLAYPKLYGAFILWLSAVWFILSARSSKEHLGSNMSS